MLVGPKIKGGDLSVNGEQHPEDFHGSLARHVTQQMYERCPDLAQKYGPDGFEKCVSDNTNHLLYLYQALEREAPQIFIDYIEWVKILLAGIGIPEEDLESALSLLRDTVAAHPDLPQTAAACGLLDQAIRALPSLPVEANSHLDSPPLTVAPCPVGIAHTPVPSPLARQVLSRLLGGKRQEAAQLVMDAANDSMTVADIYLSVFQPLLYETGRLWQQNRITVAQEHYITAATQWMMGLLYPRIFGQTPPNGYTLVATAAQGELHEIGVRMVADIFELHGWDTHFLGANVPISGVVQMAAERQADLLAISVTLPTNLGPLASLIETIRKDPDCARTRIIVGGSPFLHNGDLARQIGADAVAMDALTALSAAEGLMHERNPAGIGPDVSHQSSKGMSC